MITVRFPTGFSIQYNDLDRVEWVGTTALLYGSDRNGDRNEGWSVACPQGCVIEVVRPCRTYNALTDTTDEKTRGEVRLLQKRVASLTRSINKLGKDGAK